MRCPRKPGSRAKQPLFGTGRAQRRRKRTVGSRQEHSDPDKLGTQEKREAAFHCAHKARAALRFCKAKNLRRPQIQNRRSLRSYKLPCLAGWVYPPRMSPRPTSSRRDFLRLTTLAGATVLAPAAFSCVKEDGTQSPEQNALTIPKKAPTDWNPIAFNKSRGNKGAIPKSYHESINGADGDKKHLGKHLPYTVVHPEIPAGSIALMWGDPSKGHAKHPNAGKSDKNPEGHWYNWIRVRKATDAEAQEVESKYSAWPVIGGQDNGAYLAEQGDDPAADSGKSTIYLAKLPDDVKPGDMVRIHAHCLTHGEYVDFLKFPA